MKNKKKEKQPLEITTPAITENMDSITKKSCSLSSVNPFDYIKERSKLERPSDIVTSFREKLRLNEILEEEKLMKLFACKKSKEFEKLFFESFHPVKDVKVFLAESFGDQKASCRLISPVVACRVIEWILKPEHDLFVESVVLALINSGHLSLYTNYGSIIDKIIELKSGSLLVALLQGFTDLSDSGLTKLILFMIGLGSDSEIFEKFDNCSEFKFNNDISVSETCFLALLAMPKSVQLVKKYFVIVKESEIINLLNRLSASLKRFTMENSFKISSKCLFNAPSAKQIIEWLSVIIDSQYPLCLIQPELLKAIDAVSSSVCQEVSLNSDLMEVLPSIKEVRVTKPLDEKQKKEQAAIRISPSYIIEPSTI